MDVTNYKGLLPVAVVLRWKGASIAEPISTAKADHLFVTANESVTAFSMTFNVGGTLVTLARTATKAKPYYDQALNTFTTAPIPGPELDKLLADFHSHPETKIDLTFSYHTFFDALLEQMTRTDDDLHNLANPNVSKAILDTFTYSNTGAKIRIAYKSDTQEIKSLPCYFADRSIVPGVAGRPPGVKLVITLDFLTGINAARRVAMRKLIAMDLSKLARYGKPERYDDLPIKTWRENVFAFLSNQTKLKRGEAFRKAIWGRHKLKAPEVIAKDLRDDLDLHIITANHWGELRESMTTERYQRLLSDLFGSIHQTARLASPVSYIRTLRDRYTLGLEQCAALVLQYGTGHCGEHAKCSYSILKDIVATPGSRVRHVVHTGNANIDHAFVVYNLKVREVVRTKTTATNNTRVTVGERPPRPAPPGWEIDVWNLRQALADNAPQVGYVMDPYLDASVMKSTARELLDALNGPKRKNSHKDTDFLAFDSATPAGYTVDDIRTKTVAERKQLAKNV